MSMVDWEMFNVENTVEEGKKKDYLVRDADTKFFITAEAIVSESKDDLDNPEEVGVFSRLGEKIYSYYIQIEKKKPAEESAQSLEELNWEPGESN